MAFLKFFIACSIHKGYCLLGIGITVFLGLFAREWWILSAALVVVTVFVYRLESKEDDRLSQRYRNTRMCTRCGTFYVVKP